MKRICSLLLCLGVIFLGAQTLPAASQGQSSKKAPASKKAAQNSRNTKKKAAEPVEKVAIVNVPSSDIFGSASVTSEHVSEVLLGDEIRVLKETTEWAYVAIPSQKNYSGWIMKKNISFSTDGVPFGDKSFVSVKNARTRLIFSDGSYLNVYAGTRLPVVHKNGGRYEVIIPDGSTGFLPAESAWRDDELTGKEITTRDILDAAKFRGSEYKWGGITSGGMDCSGFVYTVFRIHGIYLKRDSYLQAEEGEIVSPDELKVGDLVFFKSGKSGKINHVGIYIGGGDFIHSSRSKQGVAVSSLSDEMYKKSFVAARRVLNLVGKSTQQM